MALSAAPSLEEYLLGVAAQCDLDPQLENATAVTKSRLPCEPTRREPDCDPLPEVRRRSAEARAWPLPQTARTSPRLLLGTLSGGGSMLCPRRIHGDRRTSGTLLEAVAGESGAPGTTGGLSGLARAI